MKNNKFIMLTPDVGDLKYYVNSMVICGITEYEKFRVIHTMGGQVYTVKETPEQIFKLIDDSNKFTLINE
jgi:hypothetical protein